MDFCVTFKQNKSRAEMSVQQIRVDLGTFYMKTSVHLHYMIPNHSNKNRSFKKCV